MIPKKGKINMTKTSVTNKGLGWRTKDTQTKDIQTKGKEIKNQKKRRGKEERKDQKKKKKTLRGNKEEKLDHIGEG